MTWNCQDIQIPSTVVRSNLKCFMPLEIVQECFIYITIWLVLVKTSDRTSIRSYFCRPTNSIIIYCYYYNDLNGKSWRWIYRILLPLRLFLFLLPLLFFMFVFLLLFFLFSKHPSSSSSSLTVNYFIIIIIIIICNNDFVILVVFINIFVTDFVVEAVNS